MRRGACAFVFFLALFTLGAYVHASTVENLQQKIAEHNSAITELEKEIAGYQEDIEKVNKETQSLRGAIKTLDLQQKSLSADIRLTERRIEATTLTVKQLTSTISDTADQINRGRSAIGESLRNVDRIETASFVTAFLGGESLSGFWETVDNLERFQEKVHEELGRQKVRKEDLEAQKRNTEAKRRELTVLKNKLSDQKQVLTLSKGQKNKLLTATKNKESEYRKLLADKVAKRDAFAQELLEFESQLRLEIDPTRLPPVGSGVLKWPLDNIKITQLFGKTNDSVRLYASGTHNGVDFRAPVGTPIKAARAGTVKGVGDTDKVCPGASYGRWVLIEHENGLSTLYAHLSLIKAESGQRVVTGETIGYGGETGYATGPHLHFTVYATQGVRIMNRKSSVCGGTYTMPVADLKAYLNPLSYL
jgi:murein DD-endopeptidase MepM/ murein hydrolase activator NlpD